jgi:hypothetical protein
MKTLVKKLLKPMLGLVVAGTLAGTSACAYVTSAQPGLSVATGEAWYTKDKVFLIFFLGTDIYYCPKDSNGTCFKAQQQ